MLRVFHLHLFTKKHINYETETESVVIAVLKGIVQELIALTLKFKLATNIYFVINGEN